MKKVEIAVCDDEYIHVERIVKYIGVYSEESEIDINVTEYNSGKLLLEAVEGDTSKYDIIFLDVEMPDFDGVNTARGIRKVSEDVIICFVTSFDKYAIAAYGVEALAYVVKPVTYPELKRVLGRAVVMVQYAFDHKEAEERYIEVQVAKNTRIVDVRNIQYIEKRRNQCVLHCSDAEITCYETLKKMYGKLDKNIFIYIGSFLVGGVFEWFCSFFQELIFGTVSWSYGKDSLGIFERTSLIYCFFWGFLGVLWVRVIYPYLSLIHI